MIAQIKEAEALLIAFNLTDLAKSIEQFKGRTRYFHLGVLGTETLWLPCPVPSREDFEEAASRWGVEILAAAEVQE